jgi:hypothetical protein
MSFAETIKIIGKALVVFLHVWFDPNQLNLKENAVQQ